MKRLFVFLCAMVLIFGVVGTANSALWDRGGGLIYDDVLDITWLQDANYAYTSGYWDQFGYPSSPSTWGRMTWYEASGWANQLVYGGYDDWRLPKTLPVNGSSYDYNTSSDGSTDRGYNISAPGSVYEGSTGSEMAYMYYVNLGNLGHEALDGSSPQPGYGLAHTGPFINLQDDDYCSGTKYAPDLDMTWTFVFDVGEQNHRYKYLTSYAWAVRDGDVSAVPIPEAVWLLGSGLLGLVGLRKKFKRGNPNEEFNLF